MQFIYLTVFICFISIGSLINCDHVPMLLWNMKGASVPMRPVSAFEVSNDKHMQELLQSVLKDEATSMLVFAGDRLSMEDLALSSNAETTGNMLKTLEGVLDDGSRVMFPSVKEPMRHFRDVSCGVKDIHAGKHNAENLDASISLALDNACVVIVHLGSKGMPSDKKLSLKTSKKNVVGVLTSSKSSWHPLEESHRSRSLLGKTEPSHFINYTGCIIMYADSVNLKIGSASANNSIPLVFPPTVTGSCSNDTMLQLTFPKGGDAPEVILTMNFKKTLGAWIMYQSFIQVKDDAKVPDTELELLSSRIDVPLSFSYSCGAYIMTANNATVPISLIIDRFQIQTYGVNGVFASSFDCVPFFTLTAWMGIFIAILFIIILNSGIYMLFNIKTMDRFDDPKGKTISVPLGTD